MDESIHLLLSVFIFIFLSADPNSDASWKVANPLAPEKLVELRVDTNVLGREYNKQKVYDNDQHIMNKGRSGEVE